MNVSDDPGASSFIACRAPAWPIASMVPMKDRDHSRGVTWDAYRIWRGVQRLCIVSAIGCCPGAAVAALTTELSPGD